MEKLPHGFGKPTVFLSGGGLRIKCGNSSLVPRFCVAKSNPCGILKEVIELVAPATCESGCKKIKPSPAKTHFSLDLYNNISKGQNFRR